jgi:hypothetical protein
MATWLAENGLAVPYRDCKCEMVREAADRAMNSKTGIWSGTFPDALGMAEGALSFRPLVEGESPKAISVAFRRIDAQAR